MQRLTPWVASLAWACWLIIRWGAGYQTQVNTCYFRDTLPYQRDELERAFVFHVKRW